MRELFNLSLFTDILTRIFGVNTQRNKSDIYLMWIRINKTVWFVIASYTLRLNSAYICRGTDGVRLWIVACLAQAITWTVAEVLSIVTQETNFGQIWIKITLQFWLKKIQLCPIRVICWVYVNYHRPFPRNGVLWPLCSIDGIFEPELEWHLWPSILIITGRVNKTWLETADRSLIITVTC